MEKTNVSSLALEKAAQAWCTDKTSHIEMDSNLATAFAEILDEIWSKPWLGNATTKEIIEELSARSDLNYKTTTGKGLEYDSDYVDSMESGNRLIPDKHVS